MASEPPITRSELDEILRGYVTTDHHESQTGHRLGYTLPLRNAEPELCTSGFSAVGNDEGPAAANHSHDVRMLITSFTVGTIDQRIPFIGNGTFWAKSDSKVLYIKFADGWYSYNPSGGPF